MKWSETVTAREYAYDSLYAARADYILWDDAPSRLAQLLVKCLPGGRVLDAGCGDGVNSVFLESKGFRVVGVDASELALKGLFARFSRAQVVPHGVYRIQDLCDGPVRGEYDALLSCGLLHCLPEATRIGIHQAIQAQVRHGGYAFFSCLTEGISLPPDHGTPGVRLVHLDEINTLFADWQVFYCERGVIEDEHLPVVGKHTHSIIWLAARKQK